MKLQLNKWYVVGEGEGVLAGPFKTKKDAKWDVSIAGEKTTRDPVYDSMYNSEGRKILAKGDSLMLAGFDYYFSN